MAARISPPTCELDTAALSLAFSNLPAIHVYKNIRKIIEIHKEMTPFFDSASRFHKTIQVWQKTYPEKEADAYKTAITAARKYSTFCKNHFPQLKERGVAATVIASVIMEEFQPIAKGDEEMVKKEEGCSEYLLQVFTLLNKLQIKWIRSSALFEIPPALHRGFESYAPTVTASVSKSMSSTSAACVGQ